MASDDREPIQESLFQEEITHSGNFGPAPERHPSDEFDNTKLHEAVEQGLLDVTPDSLATMPEEMARHYEAPAVIPPLENQFPRPEIESEPKTAPEIQLDRRSNRVTKPLVIAGASLAILATAIFALRPGDDKEQAKPLATPKPPTTLISDEVTPSTLPITTSAPVVVPPSPTPETSVPEDEEFRLYGEPLVEITPEAWLETLNKNWVSALNYGDIRYVEHAFSDKIDLSLQQQNIDKFQAEKEQIGPAYMILGSQVVSIDEQTGFDDPNALERSFTATTHETYQRYVGEETTYVEVAKFTLVKQLLVYDDEEKGRVAVDTWVIKSSETISREELS